MNYQTPIRQRRLSNTQVAVILLHIADLLDEAADEADSLCALADADITQLINGVEDQDAIETIADSFRKVANRLDPECV